MNTFTQVYIIQYGIPTKYTWNLTSENFLKCFLWDKSSEKLLPRIFAEVWFLSRKSCHIPLKFHTASKYSALQLKMELFLSCLS